MLSLLPSIPRIKTKLTKKESCQYTSSSVFDIRWKFGKISAKKPCNTKKTTLFPFVTESTEDANKKKGEEEDLDDEDWGDDDDEDDEEEEEHEHVEVERALRAADVVEHDGIRARYHFSIRSSGKVETTGARI